MEAPVNPPESKRAEPEWRRRRRVAALEVGHTRVTRRVATLATVALGLAILTVPAVQVARGGVGVAIATAARGIAGSLAELPTDPAGANRTAIAALVGLEDTLVESSPLVQELLPATRLLAVRALRVGSRDVVTGRDGWLFWRPDLLAVLAPDPLAADGLTRRQAVVANPDPFVAIEQFRADLAARGIALVVVLAPTKPEVRSDRLGAALAPGEPVRTGGVASFSAGLAARGISLVDPAPALGALVAAGTDEVFLRTDSHWTPAAVRLTAQQVAAQVRQLVADLPAPSIPVDSSPRVVVGDGDLLRLLRLPPGSAGPAEVAEVSVPDSGARLEHGSPVLLLGDSFSAIYSRPELGWGSGAGLGEQLAAQLGVAVDVVTVNAGGAAGSRRRLLGELAVDPDRLGATRVVVWEVASRELVHGDWSVLPVPVPVRGEVRSR